MSEMPRNTANYQKSDFPRKKLEIQIPLQNSFSPDTLKSDLPPTRQNPLENPDFSPESLKRNDTRFTSEYSLMVYLSEHIIVTVESITTS